MRMGRLLFFGFLMSGLLQAGIVLENGVWIVSGDISSNDYVRGKLAEVEETARTDRAEAALLLEDLRSNVEVDGVWTDSGEFLPLLIDAMALVYEDGGLYSTEKISRKCRELISKYEETAKGKKLQGYKMLLSKLFECCNRRNDFAGAMDVRFRQSLYDPENYWQHVDAINFAVEHPGVADDWDEFIADFEKAGGIMTPELKLMSPLLAFERGKGSYAPIIKWLDENYNSGIYEIIRSLEHISLLVSAKNPEFLKEYVKALSNLALRQKVGKDRLEVFSAAMNEKAKIEMIAKDLL